MPNDSSSHLTETHTAPTFVLRHPYLWAATPACALFGLSFALSGTPLPQPLVNEAANTGLAENLSTDQAQLILPASETLLVTHQSAAASVVLQGRMQPPVGSTVTAPSGGQVARVLVRPGQAVQANQEIAVISTGVVSRSAALAPVERGQTRAEQAQIAAVERQRGWQQRVRAAHERLEKAQARVQIAQARVAKAREVVQRLQNGEEVAASEAEVPVSTPVPTEAPRRARSDSKEIALRDAAMRDSQKLQQQADSAESDAAAKKRAASDAAATAKSKHRQWTAAQSAADSISVSAPAQSTPAPQEGDDKSADASKTPSKPAAENNAAKKRAAQDRANALKAEVDAAEARAASLNREADAAQARADGLRKKANAAVRQAAAALQNLRVFDNEGQSSEGSTPTVRESTPRVARSGGKISVSEAVRMARSAMQESQAAIADAERIRRQVETYERPVENTREAFDDATRRLSAAQERMWDRAEAATPNMHPVVATGGGVVLWIAELTREVRAGDPIAAVGRADRMEVVLKDNSGAWRNIRPNSQILALVQTGAVTSQSTPATPGTAPPVATVRPTVAKSTPAPSSAASMRGVPTLARVLSIQPPAGPKAPAILRVAIHNPRRSTLSGNNLNGNSLNNNANESGGYGLAGRTFAPGTPVLCSLSQPGQRTKIAIPSAAIRRDDNGLRYVAVLTPVAEAMPDINANLCRIEWRKVEVGRGDGFQNLILSGLAVGDRIALRPEAMQSFTLTHGAQATLRVEQA
jgi:multidrug efflux pump subunit AcrA (membrane-fusion protein)